MPRSYRHISNYENEILELKSQGFTVREIGQNWVLQKSKYIISSHDTIRNSECLKQGKQFTRKADRQKIIKLQKI